MLSTTFLAFALLDPNDHALTVDVGDFELEGFGEAQARRIATGQDRAMLQAGHAGQKVQHFAWTQDNGQLLGLFGQRDAVLSSVMEN
jgi:hypothetical protein